MFPLQIAEVQTLIQMGAQYGIAGIALYLMYQIGYNHLKSIDEKLQKIIELLDKGAQKT